LPDVAKNDVSTERQAAAYSNGADVSEIQIEPGLSIDILPISTFIVKLAILELLRNEQHSLVNLYDDFTASLYVWFNRQKKKSPWTEALTALGDSVDNMSIMRWYGITAAKNPRCPVCGTFDFDSEPI
jgi:hypothetical protein